MCIKPSYLYTEPKLAHFQWSHKMEQKKNVPSPEIPYNKELPEDFDTVCQQQL